MFVAVLDYNISFVLPSASWECVICPSTVVPKLEDGPHSDYLTDEET